MLYGKALLNVSIMENEVWFFHCISLAISVKIFLITLQVLGNALEGMDLEDDSKSLPQVKNLQL